MRYGYLWVLLFSLFLWMPPAPANPSAAEEFVIPLQTAAPRSTSRSSDRARKVKDELIGQPALQAKTAQTAIVAAINQSTPGCQIIRFGAGFGWVATGSAPYAASDNPVALRRSRQEARFKAFTAARTQLADCLRTLNPEARRQIAETLEGDDAIRLALINLAANDAEKWEQALRILARGFVAHSVQEQTDPGLIRVHLVATPKTATRLTRPTASAMESLSLQEGLRQSLAEIEAGLIPSTGNRLIVVNASGELPLIGYAINRIGAHPDPIAQDKLRADAEKIAITHASEALVGLANGDDSGWRNSLDEISRSELETTASAYEDNEPSARRFAQIRDLILSAAKDDPGLQTLREGNLPAAAAIKRFSSEGAVIVAVIYTPTVRKPLAPPAPPALISEPPASPPLSILAPPEAPPAPPLASPTAPAPSAPSDQPQTAPAPSAPPESPATPATPSAPPATPAAPAH